MPRTSRPSRRRRLRRRRTVAAALVVVLALLAGTVAAGFVHHGRRTVVAGASKIKGGPGTSAPPVLRIEGAGWQLPTPLSRSVALVEEGRIVLLGGLQPANKTSSAIEEIDPKTGAGTVKGALAEGVHDAAGASIGQSLLVFGGGAAKVSATVQRRAPETGDSAAKSGVLPQPRADLAAVSVDGKVVLVGGYDGKTALADVLTTSDGTTFETVAKLPQPVRYPAVAALGRKVYVIGGDLDAAGTASTSVQVIDLQAKTATVLGQLPAGLSHASAVALGEKVYVVGGRRDGHVIDDISEIDATNGSPRPVGRLPVGASDMATVVLGEAAYFLGGENDKAQPIANASRLRLVRQPKATAASARSKAPFEGQLLIADRGNNRLLLVDAKKQVQWTFPSPTAPAPTEGFYFPDDAFFAKHGTAIITNEEEQHTIIELEYPSGKEIASYGHSGQPGSKPGFLNQPDDAYLLADGRVTVADAKNCRILFLNPDFTFQSAIGTQGKCKHDIPNDVAYPNGDTPLANGNILVSEINGSYVDELTQAGQTVWSVKLPITYPSDPQQIGPDLYLIADYAKPGGLYEFTREGQITFSYNFPSGEQMLDHPSLTELLPSGLLCVNDDYRHRVVIIDPATKEIVWQYGQTDQAGTGPDQLHTPDGFDLLAPDKTTPTHPQTG